jgi:Flp pilus assembly protein TadD
MNTLKLSGDMTANGPLAAMPQMENELAWLILNNSGLNRAGTRVEFQKRMRKVPNAAYAYFIQSFGSANKGSQIQSLKRAVELYRGFSEAHYQLGQLYFSRKDCDNALTHLLQVQAEGKIHPDSVFMQGTCHLAKRQPDLAIPLLFQAVSDYRSYEALNNLGVAYLRKGDMASATNSLMDAKHLANADATAFINIAIAYLIQENYSATRAVIEDALKIHPRNGMLQFLYSVVLKRLGDEAKAFTAAAKAKNLGINVDSLQSEDPQNWVKIQFDRER